jgi:hypothetical protein
MAYSAVTHPRPVFFRKGGTVSSMEAVQMTFVFPIAIRMDPAGCRRKSMVMFTSRTSFH